jgi:hypothetical protein
MLEREGDTRTGHRQPAHHVETGGILTAGRAQELPPRRDPAEQILDPDARSRRQRCRSVGDVGAMVDHPLPALRGTLLAALERDPRHARDRRQGLATKPQRDDLLDGIVGQLRCRVALECQGHVGGAHPAAVIGHLDPREPAFGETHRNPACPRVDGILQQFLQRRSRPLDHFARRDAVHQCLGKAAYCRHRASVAPKQREFEPGRRIAHRCRHKFLALPLKSR